MNVVYFGIDALADCLQLLLDRGCRVVRIYTIPGEGYDRTDRVRQIAEARGIPVRLRPASSEELAELAAEGVNLSVTAGYPRKIPITSAFMQVNLHPSPLPEGRGPWPMPTAILKGVDSGVTLHKLSEEFDEGDILLQQVIPTAADETLITLSRRIEYAAVGLLDQFLKDPEKIWAEARPQGPGSWWPEPDDLARTLLPSDSPETLDRKKRAFAGYGCLIRREGISFETDGRSEKLYFRPLRLEDREEMERIRLLHRPLLSDFTFALLWSWRKVMKLSVCLGEDFFAVRGPGYFFAPVGDSARIAAFLEAARREGEVVLRFCDQSFRELAAANFPGAVCYSEENDCDYLIGREHLLDLPGGALATRRKDLHHYMHLYPPPVPEPITSENLPEVRALSEHCRKEGSADGEAEAEALARFSELGLAGVLVRRGGQPVGFAVCSEKDERTLQGHFSKCTERVRGGALYVIRACAQIFGYDFLNLEDDMGDSGLRWFKRSLKPEILPSFTVVLSGEEGKEQEA